MKLSIISHLISLYAVLPPALAAHVSVSINPPLNVPFNPSALPPATHATLHASGRPITASLTRANKFEFANVPVGSYLLEVHCRDYFFEPLRIDVGDEGGREYVKSWQSFRGHEWDNKGEKRGEGEALVSGGIARADIAVNVLGGKEYYIQRQGFSVLSLFKNPMILIALFSLGMIVGMPYLLENMDPETKAEFEAMQKEKGISANPAAAMQNFDLAGWMAGSGTSGSKAEPEAEPERQRQNGGGGKKRKG